MGKLEDVKKIVEEHHNQDLPAAKALVEVGLVASYAEARRLVHLVKEKLNGSDKGSVA